MCALKHGWLLVCLTVFAGLAIAGPQSTEKQEDASKFDVAVPAGTALSEPEIIILLQAKVPLEVIEKFVTVRGVNFISSKETSKKIIAAGGNVSLIGTVNLNQKEDTDISAMAVNGKKKGK
jgi:hypothetical protein